MIAILIGFRAAINVFIIYFINFTVILIEETRTLGEKGYIHFKCLCEHVLNSIFVFISFNLI